MYEVFLSFLFVKEVTALLLSAQNENSKEHSGTGRPESGPVVEGQWTGH